MDKPMNKPTLNVIVTGLLIGALLLAGVISTPAKQAAADSVVGVRSDTVLSSVNGSGYVVGDAVYTAFFGHADCYSTWQGGVIVAGAPPTVTVVLQHSPDSTTWITNTESTFAAQSSATTLFTRTNLYGAYMRASINAANTNAVTVTVKCTLKNIQ